MKKSPSTNSYELVCGLEIHAELKTNSKMFCGCKNDPFGALEPNIYTCPVCLGLPGSLPVANKKAIEWTLKIGLATKCEFNLFSKFDRKHYFYPDLAKGYQISQYDLPFCYNGTFSSPNGDVAIRRIHLEEDTGKLLHTTLEGKKVSLIDFNRSGVPLVEIVTEPDIKSAEHAKEFGKKFRQLLRFLDVADCDMEQGGMRLEANISLRKQNEKELPDYKVEVKNINSFRFLEQAILYEHQRQAEILDAGEIPAQETRGWDANKNQTVSQRGKEEAEDYRYFPDPDIPPIRLDKKYLDSLGKTLPALPETFMNSWQKRFGLNPNQLDAMIVALASPKDFMWLENVLEAVQDAQLDLQLFINDVINKKINISPAIQPAQAVTTFQAFHATETVDTDQLTQTIQQVLEANNEAVKKYQAGQQQVLGFLIGQAMKNIDKKIDPKVVRQALQTALEA